MQRKNDGIIAVCVMVQGTLQNTWDWNLIEIMILSYIMRFY